RISNRISELEDRLGIKLMERGRGRPGFRLTPQGERVIRVTDELFGSIDQFGQDIVRIKSEHKGHLRIAIPDDVLNIPDYKTICEVITAFQSSASDVQMELLAHGVDETEHDVLDGKVDICIGAVFNPRAELEYIPRPSHQCHLYCGKKHHFFKVPDSALSADRIESESLVGAGFKLTPKAAHLTARFPLEAIANHMSARLMLIQSGVYLGFLPSYFAQLYQDSGELRRIHPKKYFYSVDNAIFFAKNARQNSLVDLFIDELVKQTNYG
ncbi:MAG: hypothetical protein DRQ47_09365, partial [Gammaproteobacteria bacterium]